MDFADSECGSIGHNVIKALRERALKLAGDSALVRGDSNLSEIEREKRLRALAAQTRSNKKVAAATVLWRSAREESESLFKHQILEATQVDPPEERWEISLDSKIRAHLRSLDRKRRWDFLEQAVVRGETRPVRAVLTAPTFLSGVNRREQDDLRRQVGWQQSHHQPRELEVLQRADDLILVALRSFERIIQELTGDSGRRGFRPTGQQRRYTAQPREGQQAIGSHPTRSHGAFRPRASVSARTR